MEIKINKLRLFGYHGVYNEEKVNGQNFEINVSLEIIISASQKDNLASTVDYVEVIDKLVLVFNSNRYNLLESLINDMFVSIFSNKDIMSGEISIKKISPPIDLNFESIEVRDKRKND
tara:strand:+ start:331 stop:684 length:354 start_codon:yes stop_codon:yes gene_type:complete